MNDTGSIYAKPVVPRIVVRPALASVLLHCLILAMVTINWADEASRDVIKVKPAPKVINARLVDVSEFRPAPKPAPKPVAKSQPKPKPKAVPVKPAPKPKPKPKPVQQAKPKPAPAKPKPAPPPARVEPEPARLTQAELAALTRADLARAVELENQEQAVATAQEMSASYAALIQQTVINYWSRPPSARNGMEVELRIQLIPTGEVVSVTVIRGSGNSAFDRSAINAVEKAGSFPELKNLPGAEFERTFRRFNLLFRPEDLRY